jgi:hypothetical protein
MTEEVRKLNTQTERIIKLEKAIRWLLPYVVQFLQNEIIVESGSYDYNFEIPAINRAIKFAEDVLEEK